MAAENEIDHLQNIADMMSILEELGQAENSHLGFNLVDSKRYLITAEDAEIRLGAVDKKLQHCRFYLFNDLLIVAKYKSKKDKGGTLSGTGGKIMFGELVGRKDSLSSFGGSGDDISEAGSKATLSKKPPALKLRVWLDLSHVNVRAVTNGDNHGMRIIFTRREEHVDEEDGSVEYVTQVEQSEMWFENKEKQEKFVGLIHDAIDLVLESKMTYNQEEIVDDDSTDAGEESTKSGGRKRRNYTKGKDTMRKIAQQRVRGTLDIKNAKEGAFSLEEIAKRYQVKANKDEEAAEYSVSFNPGPMGFALSSMPDSPGVYVGKVSEDGMAEISGVTLMDRVVEVGGEPVSDTLSWQECLAMIQQKKKELGKAPLIIKFARQKSVDATIATEKEETEKLVRKKRVRDGKRAWKKRVQEQGTFGSRMQSLENLKERYTDPNKNKKRQQAMSEVFDKLIAELKKPDTKSLDPKHEKQAVFVLKEIHDTEKDYVHNLYKLVDDYLKKISKARVHLRCRDLKKGAVKFCEHKVPAFTCKKTTAKMYPLVEKSDIKSIFSNVEVLLKINEQLLHTLQSGLEELNKKPAKEITLADLIEVYAPTFVKTMPFFKMYSVYAAQYSYALEHLADLKERGDFNEKLKQLEGKSSLTLQSLLINPVSRLCKYPLLFDTLLKAVDPYIEANAQHTSATGKGDIERLQRMYDQLEETAETVKTVAETVNFKVGEHHDLERLSEIYHELGGSKGIKDFMVPSRRFCEKFDVLVDDKSKKGKPKAAILYVFNDLLVFATDKGGTLKLTGSKGTARKSLSKDNDTKSSASTMKKKKSLSKGTKGTMRTKAKVKVFDRIDITDVKVKKLREKSKEGYPGITLHKTTRETIDYDKMKKNKTGKTGTEINTYVSRLDLYAYEESLKESMADMIEKNKTEAKANAKTRKAAQVKFNQKKLRGYKTGRGGRKGVGAADSKHRMATLQKKMDARKTAKK